MVVLSGINYNLRLLSNRKQKYDKLLVTDYENDKTIKTDLYDLKRDISVLLGDILSSDYKQSVISKSYCSNVNFFKEKLNRLLDSKKLELEQVEKLHNEKLNY